MNIGILHPGQMGVSIAASAKNSGNLVYWASEGRSQETRDRAENQALQDACSLENLVFSCEIILSVCPPYAAEKVATEVLDLRFKGLYLDCNAISPTRAERIAADCHLQGVKYIDGRIIGGPAWQPGRTVLYLSGDGAKEAARIFHAGPLATCVLEGKISSASALKMCYASYTKGSTALLCAAMAAARGLGVFESLLEQWNREGSGLNESAQRRASSVSSRAWRFAGEMEEIADTFASTGIPDGFHLAAAEIYRRMSHFKDEKGPVTTQMVVNALLESKDGDLV